MAVGGHFVVRVCGNAFGVLCILCDDLGAIFEL